MGHVVHRHDNTPMRRGMSVQRTRRDFCYKCPNFIGYHSNVPWATLKINIRLIILTRVSTNAENMVKIGQVLSEIISRICQFMQIFNTGTKTNKRFSGVSALNFTKFVHDVATFNALFTCTSAYWIEISVYFNPFLNNSATMKILLQKNAILYLKLVAMATSLERSPNECRIYQALTSLYQPWKFGEDPSGSFWELVASRSITKKQEAFEKCWAHSPLRAAARRLF